jgi:hypothetical protein
MLLFVLLLPLCLVSSIVCFPPTAHRRPLLSIASASIMSGNEKIDAGESQSVHPNCLLPGDPSLILTTNVDLGAQKMEIMKGALISSSWVLYRSLTNKIPDVLSVIVRSLRYLQSDRTTHGKA